MENYLCIGKIINTHGIKGELKVQSYTDFPQQRFAKKQTVYVFFNQSYLPFVIASQRQHKGFILMTFEQLNSINDVEQYKNHDLYILESQQHCLPDGQYYWKQLIGLTVMMNGQEIGKVVDIEETNGAQNNLRISGLNKNILYPFVDSFIEKVDLEKQYIMIKDIGL